MTDPITLTHFEYLRLRTHPRCTAAHLAVIDIMIATGEIRIEGAAVTAEAPKGVA